MGIKEVLVYILFNKKCSGTNTSGGAVKIGIISNQHLPEELHKPIIEKFEKRKVYSSFKDISLGC